MEMPADFNFQVSNLLLLLVPIFKAYVDVHLFQFKGIPVNHFKSMSVALIAGFAMALIDFYLSPVNFLLQPIILSIGIFLLTFDYFRNFLAFEVYTDFRAKYRFIFYVDDNPDSDTAEDAKWDGYILAKLPPFYALTMRLILFSAAVGCYYWGSYI